MEYTKNDTSGIDDDLPHQGIIQTARGTLYSGSMRITSGRQSRITDLAAVDFQIHMVELEAYCAVLRAFIVQSDVLSWGKEGLITELRKELRVSDVEHREILGKVNSDDAIKSIRELRKNADSHQLTTVKSPCYDPISMGHVARKKLKHGHVSRSASPKYLPCSQPSPSVMLSSHVAHSRDEQWGGNMPLHPLHSNVGQALVPFTQNRQTLNPGKARRSLSVQTAKMTTVPPGFEKTGSDIIEIRATDKLIHEVEKVCRGQNPDPAQLMKAKFILREHEKALMEAIGKLADVSDGDDSPGERQNHFSKDERQQNSGGFPNALYDQYHRTGGYFYDAFDAEHAERAGIPCIDLPDDEYNQGP